MPFSITIPAVAFAPGTHIVSARVEAGELVAVYVDGERVQ